jgi:hypothetical protein
LDNDKSFAAYALVLIAGVTSTLTASVMVGFASLPSPALFLEHVALGLMMRASYKSFAGWDWAEWSIMGERAAKTPEAGEFVAPAGAAANARG